ncbi:neural cell adhesion molecule 2-like [Tachypleus tridentatus]|uniref:neural cell adhesion molecule 2-like n=1 Tax=Tachypleus tridentatus TaxID=6853 RepID=UPI003FD122A9
MTMSTRFCSWTFLRSSVWFVVFASYFLLPAVLSHLLYESVVGGFAELSCNFSSVYEDKVSLILWYKDNATKPIYILDARNGIRDEPKHLPSRTINNRSYYNVSVSPSVLQLWNIREDDKGKFKCRVDYRHEPTEYFIVLLEVIVPPRETIILDKYGQRLKDLIGPYNEDSSLLLICEADGGKPPPALTWWNRNNLLKASFTLTPQGFPRNELVLQQLRRDDLLISLTCKATNSNLTAPISSSVTVDLYLKPLDVRITSVNKPLTAHLEAELVCESWGARPAAQVSWWKGTERLFVVTDAVSPDGNHTISQMSFIPSIEDNGKNLTCRADNLLIPKSAITDVWNLVVYYTPQVTITLISPLNEDGFVERGEVQFDCSVDANPTEFHVQWLFGGLPISSGEKHGIILGNYSLVIKDVQQHHKGQYQCLATNQVGEGWSEEKTLLVQYSPVCRDPEVQIITVALGSEANISCEVDAEPEAVEFHWVLTNTSGIESVKTAVTNRTASVIAFSPLGSTDFGTLSCWAKNIVGRQKIPCIYKILPAGLPEAPNDCIAINKTKESFIVACSPGFDGGLSQTFQIEVFTDRKERLFANISSSDVPSFSISSLPAGTQFILVIYAINSLGRSRSISLEARTLNSQTKPLNRDTDIGTVHLPYILGTIFGTVVVLMVIVATNVFLKYFCVREQEIRGIKGDERAEKQVHCIEEEESPKHDAQLLDLISTKHDFSGPPDVTHISANWGHPLTVEFHPKNYSEEVVLRMDRKPLLSPVETIRWREGEGGSGDRTAGENKPSTFTAIESLNIDHEKVKWAPKSVGMPSLPRIEEDDSGISAETPLVYGLLEVDNTPQQSSKNGHVFSTAV